jgi:hypothetical protein
MDKGYSERLCRNRRFHRPLLAGIARDVPQMAIFPGPLFPCSEWYETQGQEPQQNTGECNGVERFGCAANERAVHAKYPYSEPYLF